jgi:hypothetical protein
MAELVYEERGIYYNPAVVLIRFINAVIGIIEFFLLLRLGFELLSANPASPIVGWLYDFTGRLISPFVGAFPDLSLAGFNLDISVILAMIAYAILGWLLAWLIDLAFI